MTLPKPALIFLLVTVSFISTIVLFFCKPIPQDENFHHFADIRNIFSIANCWNVISNILFLLIGITALQKLWSNKLVVIAPIKAAYYVFFTAILLVAFGSAWYHCNPNNITLLWDRLPMTIAFMSLLSIGLAEFVSIRAGRIGLIPFVVTGMFSIAWWQYGELHDNGDLRLYVLVQYLPILLLVLLFLFGHAVYNTKWGYLTLFGAYVLAKLAEHFDAGIYKLTGGLMAGHFLKHIITALGLWLFVVYLQKRKPPLVHSLSE
ncbi:MAG: alkaline phytoceramidase [Bacteroidota bacterium]